MNIGLYTDLMKQLEILYQGGWSGLQMTFVCVCVCVGESSKLKLGIGKWINQEF